MAFPPPLTIEVFSVSLLWLNVLVLRITEYVKLMINRFFSLMSTRDLY